ncbi:uncharacterized protein EI90DRAFT_507422 [Cantharellus anzutake]|uniref:uncharacterized protein n=1 Tax=Cantharellus anzutake TaxID=1750568 RepID=UPI00190566C2|nr:uncharacterized protein EI90DRAFT_507422 [Cantharellus anzutake]KAF8334106.1 hypothetical protein EI90DRAFT_507422 [Cantharellus anzutake]
MFTCINFSACLSLLNCRISTANSQSLPPQRHCLRRGPYQTAIQNSHISSHFKLRRFLIPPRDIPTISVRARDATNSALRQLKALNKAAFYRY